MQLALASARCPKTAGYALANRLHVSGLMAMVVTGLMVGNQERALTMSETTRR